MQKKNPYATARKLAILGAGESGTGAALLAKKLGIEVFASEYGQIKEPYLTQLSEAGIEFEQGGHTLAKVLAADVIIKSPGIDPKVEVVQAALAKGIPVIDELEFAGYHTNGKLIFITGTNGKTTTTLLTYHLLTKGGYSAGLAGNVGKSLAAQLARGEDYKYWVLEVSSFQLDGMPTLGPDVAVLTNITPDHLDRYETMEAYINSKLHVFDNLKPGGTAICPLDPPLRVDELERYIHSKQIAPSWVLEDGTDCWEIPSDCSVVFGPEHALSIRVSTGDKMPMLHLTTKHLQLKGRHNIINAINALLAANRAAAIEDDELVKHLATFAAPAHRLESVGSLGDVEFINDSKATNLDAVIPALKAMTGAYVWIAGGKDKGNDYRLIDPVLLEKCKALICLTKYPEPLLTAFEGRFPIQVTQSVSEAVALGYELAQPAGTVLLSPACASFDLFNNFEDRGDQFRTAVQDFISKHTTPTPSATK